MKKLLIVAAAALSLSACATTPAYHPATRPGGTGYSEYRVTSDRWRVSFAGNSVTSRDQVEMYLLLRAAELTLENGYDWFEMVDRSTNRDTRYIPADPFWGSSAWGPYWRPSWRAYRRGYWSPWGASAWGPDWDREVTRYEANAEIVMHRGPRPEGGPHAFDARDVVANLGPRVQRPAP
jgi:hypothetical protein